MHRRHSLRFRVAAAFAGLGAVLSLLFAVGIWLAAHNVSQRLIDQTLTAELEDYTARRARNPRSLPPDTASFRGYVAGPGQPAHEMPAPVRALPLGRHEITLDGVPYRVSVTEDAASGGRYYLLFNEQRQRLREQRFLAWLIGGGLLTTLLATAGGFWLAGRMIAPVTELARRVAGAPTDAPPQLSAAVPLQDEIGELTRSFDRYLARIAAFVERERAFAADASHELRTPLAVIRGAAEVLADDPSLGEAQRRRVARIERAAAEMSELSTALLLLAREEDAAVDEPCDCAQVLQSCIERQRLLADQRHNSLELQIEDAPALEVAPAYFGIVADNLVRNALAHTEDGDVLVRLSADRLVVSDNGRGIPPEELERVFERHYRGAASTGSGIGLSLVKRICDRQHWRIQLANRASGGTTATLLFA